ncbi:hypothetical protein CBL_08635 [Carabus blaptoides fortunei]
MNRDKLLQELSVFTTFLRTINEFNEGLTFIRDDIKTMQVNVETTRDTVNTVRKHGDSTKFQGIHKTGK